MKLELEFKQAPGGNMEFTAKVSDVMGATSLEKKYVALTSAALRKLIPQIGMHLGAAGAVHLTGGKPEEN